MVELHTNTCIDIGKSSAKSGGKKRSACFLVNDGFPNKCHKIPDGIKKYELLRQKPTYFAVSHFKRFTC